MLDELVRIFVLTDTPSIFKKVDSGLEGLGMCLWKNKKKSSTFGLGVPKGNAYEWVNHEKLSENF